MARRQSYPNSKWFQQPDSAYARTQGWATRYYNRKVDNSMVTALSGMNVTDDDFSKREGESPYLENVRLNGSKEARKRAQSMSRLGQRFNGMPAGAEQTHSLPASDEWIDIKEYRSVRAKYNSSGRLTSVGLYLRSKESGTNAYLLVILRDPETHKELGRAVKPVSEIKEVAELTWFRFIHTIDNDFELELTLIDDMNNSGVALGTLVQVNASGEAGHEVSEHDVPNLDEALREEPYIYEYSVNRPVVNTKTTSWRTWDSWLQKGYFTIDKNRYIVIPVINGSGQKEVYYQRYIEIHDDANFEVKENEPINLLIPASKINQNALSIRMTQAGSGLYFVDGYSPLQKVDLDTMTISNSVPTGVDMFDFVPRAYYYGNSLIYRQGQFYRAKAEFQAGDAFDPNNWNAEGLESLTAWPGASLIYFLNNRLFLGGFRNSTVGNPAKPEPNLVLMSSIDSVAPKYDTFNRQIEFFYVPDRAPSSSASSPITAFSDISDALIIFMADGLAFEQVTANVEFGGISQLTPEGASYGVLKQEHVTKGRNNIYYLNPTMGVMRMGGSISNVISRPVDSVLKGIAEDEYGSVSIGIHKDMLRLYYPSSGRQNSECLINYTQYAQQKSYWYHDVNTPVKFMNSDSGYDVELGVGSEYPCVIQAEDGLRDFDCAIGYLYYTRYLNAPNRMDGLITRRVHVTTLQDFNSSMFIGLDYDHSNKPIVWRKFISKGSRGEELPEDVFGDDNEVGATNLSIRILTTKTHFVQIRLKQYCYDYQAEILQVGLEYGTATNL